MSPDVATRTFRRFPGIAEGAHQAGHHPGGEILEGGRRPLIEAHDVFACKDILQRHRVVVGVVDDPPERLCGDLLREEGLRHEHRGFCVGRPLEGLECLDGEDRDLLRA